MRTVNMHKAKTNLSKLVDAAAKEESFIIAKAGKPMVKVTAVNEAAVDPRQRMGFMQGKFTTPPDFDRWAEDEILEMFGVKE